MPLILVVIGMIAFGGFWAYPKYQIMQLEDEARTGLKSGGFSAFAEQTRPVMQAMKMDFSVLDQYPNIRFYMRHMAYEGDQLDERIKLDMQAMSCESINSFKVMEPKARTAMLNVLEQDQIIFHVYLKNKLGEELMHHEQKLSQCPNFIAVRHYERSSDS